MLNFVQTLRLKGTAEEDVYFARRDRELIQDLRKKRKQSGDSPHTRGNHATRSAAGQK